MTEEKTNNSIENFIDTFFKEVQAPGTFQFKIPGIKKSADIMEHIYRDLYQWEDDNVVNIFLCGAATSNDETIRDKLFKNIQTLKNTNVVFPEVIFSTLLSNKIANLLQLEKLLAHSADIIILPLEGAGAICELGAFSISDKLRKKLLVINLTEHKKQQSLINQGPIDLLEREGVEIIYYPGKKFKSKNITNLQERAIEETIGVIKNWTRRKQYITRIFEKNDLENIFNFSRFLTFVIAVFQPLYKTDLEELLLTTEKTKQINIEHTLDPCLKLLVRQGNIKRTICPKSFQEQYRLTEKGHSYVFDTLIERKHLKRKFTRIRTEVLNSRGKKGNFSPKGELKFLEPKQNDLFRERFAFSEF